MAVCYSPTTGDAYRRNAIETTIATGAFKARCLQLLDEVATTREALVITKRGKPVAKLIPMPPEAQLFGALAGSVISETDIVAAIALDWDLTSSPASRRFLRRYA